MSLADGYGCFSHESCKSHYCNSGRCAPPTAFSPCSATLNNCPAGYECNYFTKHCLGKDTPSLTLDSCSYTSECLWGDYCLKAGGRGAGTCEVRKRENERCTIHQLCEDRLACVEGKCQRMCLVDENCRFGETCTSKRGGLESINYCKKTPKVKHIPTPKPVSKPVDKPVDKPVYKPVSDPKPSPVLKSPNSSPKQESDGNKLILPIGIAVVLLLLALITWRIVKSKRAKAEAQQQAIAAQLHAVALPQQPSNMPFVTTPPFVPYKTVYPDLGQGSLPEYSPPAYQDIAEHSQDHDEKGSVHSYDSKI